MCAFIPKYHWFPCFVWCISGSRSRRRFSVDDGTSMMLASTIALSFATFFLNRTNRSGIIKGAGFIGGLDQTGRYKIDCRFNREALAHQIRRVARYRSRIHVTNLDVIAFIDQVLEDSRAAFLYVVRRICAEAQASTPGSTSPTTTHFWRHRCSPPTLLGW